MIVDDEPDAVELLVSNIRDLFSHMDITGTYYNWKEAFANLKENAPDILFLDISMPGKSGIDMLKLLPEINFEIIFTTAHADYSLPAFKLFATGYLLKPINDEEFTAAVNKGIERAISRRLIKSEPNQEIKPQLYKLGVPNKNGIDYVDVNEILYLESINKYTRIVTTSSTLISSYNIGFFKKLIDQEIFYPVHRSYIINIQYMKRYDSIGYVVMSNAKEIPVARSIRDNFLTRFMIASRTR